MADDPSDSAYDLAPVPHIVQPHSEPAPVVLQYRRVEPINKPPDESAPPKPAYKMPVEERLFYWVRTAGSLAVIVVGLLLTFFFSWWIGFTVLGIGLAYLIFSGPSDAEKRGYKF